MHEYEWNAVLSIHTYAEKILFQAPHAHVAILRAHIIFFFFFICPNYSNARNLYLPSNLNDLNTHQLLHGKPDVPDSANERLFLQVQAFFMHSRRFI